LEASLVWSKPGFGNGYVLESSAIHKGILNSAGGETGKECNRIYFAKQSCMMNRTKIYSISFGYTK
jgi:hypothetical protein